jgi:signal transduction histidine kinase/ligand-binding sensor domain-containing protein
MSGVRRTTSSLLLLSVILCLSTSTSALDPNRRISQYGHTAWRVQDGAIAGVSPIAQTTDGYIWLGSSDGLMRFDGVRFVPWQLPKGQSLPGRGFTSLLGSRDGSLWIGTTGGLSCWKDGQLRIYTDPADSIGVNIIIEDSSGTIWATLYGAGARQGPLCSVSGETLRRYGKNDGLPVDYGVGFTQDKEGNFWFASSVLCRWRPGAAATTFFDGIAFKIIQPSPVVDVAADPSGNVWATLNGTGPGQGVQRYSEGKWASYVIPGFDGSKVWSHALFVDRQGTLWVGTENDGIYRIRDGVADHYSASDGLSGNSVSFFYEDREGNIWLSTDGGIDMFRNTSIISYSIHEGLSAADLKSVLALRDGSVWLANLGGIDILRSQGRTTLVSGRELTGRHVTAMLEDHSGAVWLGADLKLLIFQNGHFREINRIQGQPFAAEGEVTGIAEDTSHRVWVTTLGGQLFNIVGDRIQQQALTNGTSSSLELVVADLNGGVWIGSKRGTIFHYREGQIETIEVADSQGPVHIFGLFVDADDSLLVPTGRGLYRWKDGQLSALTTEHGLPCDAVYTVISDDQHALWIYARCGLLRVEATEWAKWCANPDGQLLITKFDALDGMRPGFGRPFQPLSSKAPDGRLWFAGYVTAQVVDPNNLYQNNVPPSVFVETVVADHNVLPAQSSMKIPALTRDLQIDFTALSFAVPQKVHFRYLLEGHDPDWQDAGTRRQAFYSNLTPGNYHFRVIACNSYGVWNETGASLDFTVLPAYYQTIWFRFAIVCVILLLLWLLYQVRVRHLHRQFEIGFEARVAERTRIARELHDTLLQSFQGLLLRFQSASNLLPGRPEDAMQRLDTAIEHAAKAITEGRDAVRDLRSTTLATHDLASDISMLASELGVEQNETCAPEFSMQMEGRPRNLHPIARDEVYRIATEALRNAFKHSGSQRIELEIRYGERDLRLRIRDDGKGIDPAISTQDPTQGHWGMSGMRERATLLGGNLEFWSEVDSGTEVELIIPASVAYTEREAWYRRLLTLRKGT